ncbi:MAG: hypothetical protein R3B99_11615 [Polyangiales bacterium]
MTGVSVGLAVCTAAHAAKRSVFIATLTVLSGVRVCVSLVPQSIAVT